MKIFCCRDKAVIEFLDLNNLDQIVYTHSVAPNNSDTLCQASPSVLLYIGGTVACREIRWLDCSTIPPKESQVNVLPMTTPIWNMCFDRQEASHKRLVIFTARGPEGIHAYNIDTKSIDWIKTIDDMENAGVTTDGHGHLFICDAFNDCVHMLSVSDGKYLGCLTDKEKLGLVRPTHPAWSEDMSSLIVAHAKEDTWCISSITIQ